MADNTTVHIGENSPEQVAYKLLWDVIRCESKDRYDREYLLTTYVQCFRAVRGFDPMKK